MPAPSMTVLLHPDGDNLDSVLHARTARLTVHDPMWNRPLCCAASVCRWR